MLRSYAAAIVLLGVALVAAIVPTPRLASADLVQIVFENGCSIQHRGYARVIIRWTGLEAAAKEVFLDISEVDDSFAPGTFTGHGPFEPNRRMFTMDPTPGGTTMYVRTNQWLEDDTWSTSRSFRLITPNCGIAPTDPLSPLANAPTPPPVPVTLFGFSDQDVGFSEANITPDGGSIRNCEPLQFYIYFKGSNATFTLASAVEVRVNGRQLEVARGGALFRSGSDPMWRVGFRVLGGSAPPGAYVVKFMPSTGPTYEASLNFTC
jgi:hypothetical protein